MMIHKNVSWILWMMAALLGVAPALAQRPVRYSAPTVVETSGTLTAIGSDFGQSEDNVSLRVVTLAWTSTTSGTVLATIPILYGTIERVVTNPTDTPTDDWDVTLTDADGADLFCGLGTNRDQTNTEAFVPLLGNGTGIYGATMPGGTRPVMLAGKTILTITSAGSEKGGVIRLYLRR